MMMLFDNTVCNGNKYVLAMLTLYADRYINMMSSNQRSLSKPVFDVCIHIKLAPILYFDCIIVNNHNVVMQ